MSHVRLLNKVSYDNIQMYWSVKEGFDQTLATFYKINRYNFEPAIQPEPPLLIGPERSCDWSQRGHVEREGADSAEESAVALETDGERIVNIIIISIKNMRL